MRCPFLVDPVLHGLLPQPFFFGGGDFAIFIAFVFFHDSVRSRPLPPGR